MPRHVGTTLRMSSRYVRILAIKRSGGKTTLYHPSSPRLDPHDVTPQNYLKTGGRFTGHNTWHYNRPGSNCQHACCKLGKGTTSVQNTPPLLNSSWIPQPSVSMGLGGWVSKFANPFVPSRQNGDIDILESCQEPLPKQMKGQHPGLPNTTGIYI